MNLRSHQDFEAFARPSLDQRFELGRLELFDDELVVGRPIEDVKNRQTGIRFLGQGERESQGFEGWLGKVHGAQQPAVRDFRIGDHCRRDRHDGTGCLAKNLFSNRADHEPLEPA